MTLNSESFIQVENVVSTLPMGPTTRAENFQFLLQPGPKIIIISSEHKIKSQTYDLSKLSSASKATNKINGI